MPRRFVFAIFQVGRLLLQILGGAWGESQCGWGMAIFIFALVPLLQVTHSTTAWAEETEGFLQAIFHDGIERFVEPVSFEDNGIVPMGPQTDTGALVDGETNVPPYDGPLAGTFKFNGNNSPSGESGHEKKWYDRLSVRGYAQFRFNDVVHMEPGSAPPYHSGDGSVSGDRNFLIRRARLIVSGDVHENVFVYLQADFANSVQGSVDQEYYAQMRDWYADLYVTKDKVHRFRVGQSKIPYGWEKMQSSSNRIPLDRADGLNSAQRNERDLGIFYYYTPVWVQDIFTEVMEENLKGSGNYGMFGVGIYNGQGGSNRDFNSDVHAVARLTWPIKTATGQIMELGIQGYTGQYVVLGSPILPDGIGPPVTPSGTGVAPGQLDQRLAGSLIIYPQPWGFQSEWNIGRGPSLNDAQTAVVTRSLYGGYAMLFYKYDSPTLGTFFPYVRYDYYRGGYKVVRNAPFSVTNDWELGCEWQFNSSVELTAAYLFADRTNLNAMSSGESYRPFIGNVLRFQLQVNY